MMTDGSKAASVAGHFGECLQGRLGLDGPVVLVTLPCPTLSATATLWPGPASCTGVLDAADRAALLEALGRPGLLALSSNMRPGGGAGVSTASRLAARRAVFGVAAPDDEARFCLALEGATDPLMHPDPGALLWASREARVLERGTAPEFDVTAGYLGASRRTDPARADFADVSDLVERWRSASGPEEFAAVASESARRAGADPELFRIARATGALGVALGHTGPAAALLFAPGRRPRDAARALEGIGAEEVFSFSTPG